MGISSSQGLYLHTEQYKHIVTDLLSALLSNGSVNKPQQRDCFYVVRDATVATQRLFCLLCYIILYCYVYLVELVRPFFSHGNLTGLTRLT
jgi:hypothetical protein